MVKMLIEFILLLAHDVSVPQLTSITITKIELYF